LNNTVPASLKCKKAAYMLNKGEAVPKSPGPFGGSGARRDPQ
jgi:hypothetical protein